MTTWAQLIDRTTVALTTPEVGRVFLACDKCQRIKAHYHLYAARGEPSQPQCRCGATFFRPTHISELAAAWRVVVVGWLWRKTLRGRRQWDPRMPVRQG